MGIQLNLPYLSSLNLDHDQLFGDLVGGISRLVPQDLSNLRGRKAVYCAGGKGRQPIAPLSGKNVGEPILFRSNYTPTLVAAIDSSTLPVCDLEDGSIIAIRSTVVFSANGGPIAYLRLGPYPYHVTANFAMSRFGISKETVASAVARDKILTQSLLRKIFERSISIALLGSISNTILLIDGTFGYGISSAEKTECKRMLALAKEKSNSIVGFAKITSIRNLLDASASLFSVRGAPFYIRTSNIRERDSADVQTILGKFRDDGFVFRLDLPAETYESVLERLSGNDHFERGYPDSLRLAHHFSVFTQHEDTCLKGRLGNELGLVEVPSVDQRKAVLGWMWSAGAK